MWACGWSTRCEANCCSQEPPTGVLLAPEQVPAVMVAAAEAFLEERTEQQSEAWRLAELLEGPQRVLARLGLQASPEAGEGGGQRAQHGEARLPQAHSPWAGWVQEGVGVRAVVVGVPLGVLDGGQAVALAEAAELAGPVESAGGLGARCG